MRDSDQTTPHPRPSPAWAGYAFAAAAVGAATLVRLALDPVLGDQYPIATYFGAVAAVAWFGRTGPAVLALVLGLFLAPFLFVSPRHTLTPADRREAVGMGLFVGVGGAMVAMGRAARQNRGRADRLLAEAGERGERLRTTLASIGDAVVTTDTAGRVTNLNPVAEALTGWATADAAGRPLDEVFRIVNEATRAAVESPAARALREGVIVGLANHTVLIARDGTERPIDDSAAPIRDAGGAVVGCVLVFRDIGDRKRAEADLRASEERRRLALDAAELGAWNIDPATNVLTSDDRFRLLFHGSTAPISYEEAFAAVHPDDRQGVREAVAAATRPDNPAPYAAEYRVVRPDGTERWVDAKGRANFVATAAGRRLASFDGTVADVTARKAAEADLRASEEFNRSLMDGSPDCVKVLDPAGRLLLMNGPGLCAMEIDDFAPFCGRAWNQLWPAESAAEIGRAVASAVGGRAYAFEAFCPTARGTPRWWDVAVSPVRTTPDGPVVRLLAVSRDVTARKRAEADLRAGAARQAFLVALADALRPLSDPVAVQAEASRLLGEHLRAHRVLYFEIRGDDYVIERDFAAGVASLVGRYPVASFGEWLRGEFAAGRTVVEADATAVPGRPEAERAAFAAIGVFGHADVPLVKDGAFVAGLTVHFNAPRVWTAAEVELIEESAERTWAAVVRARAEAALRASEERFRVLFDTMDEGFVVIEVEFDPAGRATDYRHVEANPAFEKHTGLRGVLGRSVREAVPGLEEFWFDTYGRVAATGEPVRFEHLAGPLGGRWFDVFASRVGGPGSRRVAILFTDVTARKRAELALRESEERYRLVGQAANDAIWDWDLATGLVAWNERVRTLFGYAADQVGADAGWWAGNIHPDDRGRVVRDIHAVIDGGGEGWQAEYRFRRADGTHADVFDRGQVVRRDGAAVRMVGSMLDLTERKRLETELRRYAADLSEADRRKDEFLATLAHELRNPLAPIRNGLQVLRTAGIDGAAADRTRDMMDRQLTHLVRLVDDLMDVGRITQGKLELRRETTDLTAAVEAAVEASRPALDAAGHELAADLPAGPVWVDGDPARLAQVVSNLLNNSAKYTPPGGRVRLTVSGKADGGRGKGDETSDSAFPPPPSPFVELTVADDGVGIPPAMLGKVFDIFTQVDRTLEKTTGGLGIGLSLVKAIVERHGGTVEARSEGQGRGSEFVVRLPLLTAEGGRRRAESAPATGSNSAFPRPPSALKVLVVDDNADAADSLAQLLELMGHEAATAHDGEAGVAAAERFRPDAVLMDLGMPKMNGYEAARRIREQPWGRGMVLAALTGWGQEEDREKTAAAGFDRHLVKPVEHADLARLLAEAR